MSRYLAKYQEVGEALGGVSLSTVRRLVDKGQLRKVKVGGQVFVPIESVEAFIARGGTAA